MYTGYRGHPMKTTCKLRFKSEIHLVIKRQYQGLTSPKSHNFYDIIVVEINLG